MIDFDAVIYSIITGSTDVMTLVGTYTDGVNTIKKVFPFAAPLREGSKVNPPLIVFNKAVTRDNTMGNSACVMMVDVTMTIIHTSYDGANAIALEMMDYLTAGNTFTYSGTPVRVAFDRMDYAQVVEGFDPMITALDINYNFKINIG